MVVQFWSFLILKRWTPKLSIFEWFYDDIAIQARISSENELYRQMEKK